MKPMIVVAQCVTMIFPMLAASQSRASSPPLARTLSPANAFLSEDFSWLGSVRELSDGRVVVADEKDARVAIADFRVGTVTTLGRKGDGPGEYRQTGRLWPIGRDSTMMSVPYANRWLILDGSRFVTTMGGDTPAMRAMGSGKVAGTDFSGNVVAKMSGRNTTGKISLQDSALLIRINRISSQADTVGRLRPEGLQAEDVAPVGRGGPPVASGERRYNVSLKAVDQPVAFPDGSVAIVRGRPYRVDWCTPRRGCDTGPVLENRSTALSDGDKMAYLKRASALSIFPQTENPDHVVGWPQTLPPFIDRGGPDDGVAWAAPANTVVVERTPSSASRLTTYDLIGRDGHRVSALLIPLNERIIGFGAKSVYIAVSDADGLQHLRRHAWP